MLEILGSFFCLLDNDDKPLPHPKLNTLFTLILTLKGSLLKIIK